ncbi:MAG: hypothetical protein ILO53_03775 [Clostridia bacterium]|nr:hypothetical protein [Clostridia bacterium]
MRTKKINFGLVALIVAVIGCAVFVIAASGINHSDERSIKALLEDFSRKIKSFEESDPYSPEDGADSDYQKSRVSSADKALAEFYTENATSDALKAEFMTKDNWKNTDFSLMDVKVTFKGFSKADVTMTIYSAADGEKNYSPVSKTVTLEMVKQGGRWLIDFWGVRSPGFLFDGLYM